MRKTLNPPPMVARCDFPPARDPSIPAPLVLVKLAIPHLSFKKQRPRLRPTDILFADAPLKHFRAYDSVHPVSRPQRRFRASPPFLDPKDDSGPPRSPQLFHRRFSLVGSRPLINKGAFLAFTLGVLFFPRCASPTLKQKILSPGSFSRLCRRDKRSTSPFPDAS